MKVSVKYIIADTPCRASMEYIKTSGYHSCERCTVKGRPWKSTIVFPGVNFPKRDNTTFQQRVHPSHHKVGERSILEELHFDMVLGFPQEPMHEIYGGCVQRRLLKWFVKGHFLPSRQRVMICENVKRIARSITEDFARKIIDLNKVNQWKCSEFRTFLLYTCPVAFAGTEPCKYNLFILLFAAVYIMAHPIFHKVSTFLENAIHFCEEYFIKLEEMYGYQEIVKKVHNLQHLPDDVLRNGPLEETSAFRFENCFQLQFNTLLSGNNIPSQVLNRIA